MKARLVFGSALLVAMALGSPSFLAGCGSSNSSGAPAPISPEAEKKKEEMLQNYGKQAADRGRAERQKKKP